jgi:hypothetical protein
MNDRQRAAHMQQNVLPVFRELLRAYDATAYANVTCATCHGQNARQVHFRMPNTLPTLPRFGTPEAQSFMQQHRRMYAFMGQRVVPVMAQLLGTEPFNMETRQGFGCAGCHPREGASASPSPAPAAAH